MSVIYGGWGDDEIYGDIEDDIIVGFGGNDILFGLEGNDTLVGWEGNDYLSGGSGNDLFRGGQGADVLSGGRGNDTAEYGVSRTGVIVNLLTGTGSSGEAQGDRLLSIENITGSPLGDVLIGNDVANVLDGWVGNDFLSGGSGNDRLIGSLGDDVLVGGTGRDALIGGDGFDTADYAASSAGVYVDLVYGQGYDGDAEGDTLSGIDAVTGSSFGDTLIGNDDDNLLSGGGGSDYLRAYAGHDYIVGGEGIDYAFGDRGSDTLFGESGDDILVGGADSDTMHGGRGYDTYYVDNGGDRAIEQGEGSLSDGIDLVYSAISFNLAGPQVFGAVENLTLTGTGNLTATGNALANVLVGNSGDNTLIGGAGGDSMRGGAGYDVYFVDSGADVVDESVAGSNGIDRVNSSISFALAGPRVRGAIENLTLIGTANINGVGNGLANIITGNSGANILNGLDGNDWLIGGSGSDRFVFGNALNAGTNVDRIGDFSSPQDTIAIDNLYFSALTRTGTLAADAFHVGAAAGDLTDRIIYNSSTGALLYDADGNRSGGVAAVQFAILTGHPGITSADFIVF